MARFAKPLMAGSTPAPCSTCRDVRDRAIEDEAVGGLGSIRMNRYKREES